MQSFVVPSWTIPSHLQLRQFFIFAAYEPWVYSKKMATCLVFPTCYWILCPHRTSGCVDTAITMRLLVLGDRLCHLRHRLDMWVQGALPETFQFLSIQWNVYFRALSSFPSALLALCLFAIAARLSLMHAWITCWNAYVIRISQNSVASSQDT